MVKCLTLKLTNFVVDALVVVIIVFVLVILVLFFVFHVDLIFTS